MPIGYTRPALRLRPSTGRMVSLTPVMEVASAFKKLDIMCARNQVRSDSNRQRFHERPGLKRKRLASERWRRRFGAGFKATVARVKQLRKQGW
ncbi:hypothetical protein BJ875DRAFT_366732 [Amylocarpus encephaloides]|uniref:Ribosomal protein S21 n=1 Tax=Amylocarpus encephaloides TaxID=45428 RepID=A0A9P7YS38_9HELO|nr:hypothetical protein BJ875DRAFT_366732 [Amylocarpus encephaloides]